MVSFFGKREMEESSTEEDSGSEAKKRNIGTGSRQSAPISVDSAPQMPGFGVTHIDPIDITKCINEVYEMKVIRGVKGSCERCNHTFIYPKHKLLLQLTIISPYQSERLYFTICATPGCKKKINIGAASDDCIKDYIMIGR